METLCLNSTFWANKSPYFIRFSSTRISDLLSYNMKISVDSSSNGSGKGKNEYLKNKSIMKTAWSGKRCKIASSTDRNYLEMDFFSHVHKEIQRK